MGAYLNQKKENITNTIKILKYFQEFLKSNYNKMIDPYSGWTKYELNKIQAKKKLEYLIHVAINRKAGIPDTPKGRKYSENYQLDLRRDYNKLKDIKNRIIVRSFNLPEINKRFSHLLYIDED